MSNFLDRAYTAQRAVGIPFRLCWAGLFVVAAGVLFVGNGYQLFQATMLLTYAVSLLGLNLLTGYNGQISLGHGAFFGIGAYTVAILMDRFGLPYWLVVPLAGIVSLVIGYAFAWPALKLDGIYLALATFGLGVATPQLLKCRLLEQMDRRCSRHCSDQARGAIGVAFVAGSVAVSVCGFDLRDRVLDGQQPSSGGCRSLHARDP
ncbi:branched-chain amino acid ABC transporter permease [Paraburkholderia sp. MM5482-R1]|uniref:branched-chain amino acid ABC transporter permease n=1 Tax=Paraburkholderia sp. MM5482-R1 TaxID=2991063 RepID=UPI003D1C2B73